MKTAFIALRALLVGSIFLTIWTWLAWRARGYDLRHGAVLPDWTPIPGLFLLICGCALMLACVVTFVVVGEGTPAPLDPPRKFIATGPYRYVRNPMYIGGVLSLVGLAMFWRAPAVLLLAGGFWLLFAGFVLLVEEPMLRKKFGEQYIAYCRMAPRWVPRMRS